MSEQNENVPAEPLKKIDLDIVKNIFIIKQPDPDNIMDSVLEKLKVIIYIIQILDYEYNFCEPNNVSPFDHSYFALNNNQKGIQLQNFNMLVVWLMNLSKQNFTINEYDDPDVMYY